MVSRLQQECREGVWGVALFQPNMIRDLSKIRFPLLLQPGVAGGHW